jgi:hypothetical protein
MGARIAVAATILALVLMAWQHAGAAEPVSLIALSCDGTVMNIVVSSDPGRTWGPEPSVSSEDRVGHTEPIKITLVLNFAEGTVSGFDPFIVHIDSADDTSISFKGETFLGGNRTIMGSVSRVTGALWAHTVTWIQRNKEIERSYDWNLVCKVTSRLF